MDSKADAFDVEKEAGFIAYKYPGNASSQTLTEFKERIAAFARRAYEKGAEDAAKIADREIVKHQGHAGDYDAGAGHCASTILRDIRALKPGEEKRRVEDEIV